MFIKVNAADVIIHKFVIISHLCIIKIFGRFGMNEFIYKRKSVRKYDFAALDAAVLDTVREKIKKLVPLMPDINYSIEIADKTKGLFSIKAPHYLLFYSETKDKSLENIGFVGQQMDLFFSANGLGSCWLGASKPESVKPQSPPFVVCMAFGKPAEPLHREASGFSRKPLNEISEGTDARIEAARLAPSAMNAQNWLFVAGDGKIRCYRKKTKPGFGMIYNKLHSIDMGIALCHIAEESGNFRYVAEADAPAKKGFIYAGTVI